MIDWITQMILQADIVFLLILFFSERNSPSKILLWALVFFAMPIVGFIVYIFIGQTFYSDQKFKDKSIRDAAMVTRNEKAADSEPDPEYRRTAKAVLNLGGIGFSDNNDVKLYTLGEDKFKDLYDDLRNAKRYIHLEYYIIRDDELGNELALVVAAKERHRAAQRLDVDAPSAARAVVD